MESPVHNAEDLPEFEANEADDRFRSVEKSWLAEIVEQLECNPQECAQAVETLETLELDLCLEIVEELATLGTRPGAAMLLRLLCSARDSAIRSAATLALRRMEDGEGSPVQFASPAPGAATSDGEKSGGRRESTFGRSLAVSGVDQHSGPPLTRCLVTPVDGQGRGLIVVSVSQGAGRRTAGFLCDVRLGIRDVVGESGPDSVEAGGLIDALDTHAEGHCVRDIPELALSLLAGSLMLCGSAVPAPVRDWLSQTLGPGFRPAGLPATIPGVDITSIGQSEMSGRVAAVLDACPSWLDASPLTFELAEEIWLREGRITTNPERDAGAYRYLFEHQLIHCLELYQRMLLWMAWLWKYLNELELSRSALALASQLLDEQYAVPSHPFTVELTSRSLEAAQRRLRGTADPHTCR